MNGDNHGPSPSSFSARRPFPGQQEPQVVTNSSKAVASRERPSPGSSAPRPHIIHRSIKPEWNEPSPPSMQKEAVSPPSKKLGTPEGLASEAPSLLSSSPRMRPSPEGINFESTESTLSGRKLERSRPPSPGMGSTSSKRPPSPGTFQGSGTRVPPSPGRISPAPPDRVDYSTTHSLNKDKTEAGNKAPERQKSVRFDESPPRERFIFSPNPAEKASLPSRIHVSSTVHRRLPAPEANENIIASMETNQSTAVESLPEPKLSPSRNKKNDNPVRNNPLFLQKMAEAAESDSDDDEELKMYNASEKISDSSQKKLTGMAKMKKLVELSSIKDMSPLSLNKNDDGDGSGGGLMLNDAHVNPNVDHDNNKEDDDDDDDNLERPVTFLDGPRLKIESKHGKSKKEFHDNRKRTVPGNSVVNQFADAPKHWAKVNQTSPSKRKILEGMKNNQNRQASSPFVKHEDEVISDLSSPSSKSSTSPKKILSTPPTEIVEEDSASLAPEDKANSFTDKEGNSQTQHVPETAKLSSDLSKKMTISEKLEKRKLSRVPVRQHSNASAASIGNSSKSAASIGKTRREMLDKVKGRMSRSPSPSPLIQRHMTSPKVVVEKKTPMQKLIEARQKKSVQQLFESNHNRATSNSSGQLNGSMKIHTQRSNDSSKSQQQLKSVPSLVSAPSDEKAVTISIAKSASSEHLSVQKGLYLAQKQNAAIKQLHQPQKPVKEKDSQVQSKIMNGAPPKTMAGSSESKSKSFHADKKRKNMNEIALQHSPLKGTDSLDDDNFSIDEFPEELSPNPSPPDHKMSTFSTRQSKWAEVMEDRLKRSKEDSHYLDSEDNYDGGSWSSDDGHKMQVRTPNPKTNMSHQKATVSQRSSFSTHVSHSIFSRDEPLKQNVSVSHSLPPKEKESSRNEYLFKGAYAELLPRSTNPLLVRTCKPTLPSSLMTVQRPHLHLSEQISEASNVLYTSLDTQLNETKDTRTFSHIPEQNTNDQDVWPSSNSDDFKECLETGKISDVSEKVTQHTSPPTTKFETSDRQSNSSEKLSAGSKQDMDSPDESKREKPSVAIESTNQSNGDIQQPLQEEDASYLQDSLVESTLIGQFHVDSYDIDSDACIQNQSIAEWWDKSYAHTQDDEVNSDIKQALSNSRDSTSLTETQKNAGDDSDDDVFYGLDDGSPKAKSSKHKHEIGRSHLDPIPSQDDSDFEMIMNGDVTPSPKHKKDASPNLSSPHSNSTGASFKNSKDKPSQIKRDKPSQISKETSKDDEMNQLEIKQPSSKKPSKADRSSRKVIESKNVDDLTIEDSSVDEGTSGDDSYNDSGTYDDTQDDNGSVSNKSSTSDGSYTLGSDTLESMSLSERERRKWSDWDKKDHDTTFSGDTEGRSVIGTEQLAVMERRARSHESLLMHAYTALSKPPPKKMVEKGSILQPQLASSGSSQYYSDGENQLPGKSAESLEAYQKCKVEVDRFFV